MKQCPIVRGGSTRAEHRRAARLADKTFGERDRIPYAPLWKPYRAPPQPPLPPISYMPQELRAAGLTYAHGRPLVSWGKQPEYPYSTFRVWADEAWAYLEIELNTSFCLTVIVIDCDYAGVMARIRELKATMGFPEPSWVTVRRKNGHAHVVYVLANPVYTKGTRKYPANRGAQMLYARVRAWLTEQLDGDPAYRQHANTTHNPAPQGAAAEADIYETYWFPTRPYALHALHDHLPDGYRMPRRRWPKLDDLIADLEAGASPNPTLLKIANCWGGPLANMDKPMLPYLQAVSRKSPRSISPHVIRHTAAQGEAKRQARLAADAWHSPEWLAKQATLGGRSGEARAARILDRDLEFVRQRRAGWSTREIAAHADKPISKSAVHKAIARMERQPGLLVPIRPVAMSPTEAERRKRRRQVAELLAQGLSQREIARWLKCSRDTIRRDIAALSGSHAGGGRFLSTEPTLKSEGVLLPVRGVSARPGTRDPGSQAAREGSGGSQGGEPRNPDFRTAPSVAEARRRRSDVRLPVDFGRVDAPPPVVAAQIEALYAAPDNEMVGIPPLSRPAERAPPVANADLEALRAAHIRQAAEVDVVVSDAPPARDPPLLTLDQLRALPSLNALRILGWAGRRDGLAVGDLTQRITSGRERKVALEPLLDRGLIAKVGKRPHGWYTARVRLPPLRDGKAADYLDDPDTTWAYLAVMLGVALGAPVDSPGALARAIGLDRGTVRPQLAEARAYHRVLYELTGIEAAVAHADGPEPEGEPPTVRPPPDPEPAPQQVPQIDAGLEALRAATERNRARVTVSTTEPGRGGPDP